VWEVLGHFDVMVRAGVARETLREDGSWRYSLARGAGSRREQGLALAG
jgi:hypothetical protein